MRQTLENFPDLLFVNNTMYQIVTYLRLDVLVIFYLLLKSAKIITESSLVRESTINWC